MNPRITRLIVAIAAAALLAPLAAAPAAAESPEPPDDPVMSFTVRIVSDPPLELIINSDGSFRQSATSLSCARNA
ncbi:hypothetical protein [Microbacterium sp. CPCC 204701]|uniref:hypothetical protein n=1 Tax=Microbacterium sp. CPCC 204701 TaxID=2493084 RepID=UPI000FDC6C43|nr:hypothetical protein [Microbacterium sp. CPCC 204701]